MPEATAIDQLVPHAKPMLLLDEVLQSGSDYIVCGLEVRQDGLFDSNGEVPALVGLEYMAQTVAAFSGLQAAARGEKPRLGFLLGTRKFVTNTAEFTCGASLTVRAQQAIKNSDGMAAFECVLKGTNVEQTATLTVYEPANPEHFLRGGNQ